MTPTPFTLPTDPANAVIIATGGHTLRATAILAHPRRPPGPPGRRLGHRHRKQRGRIVEAALTR